MSMRRVSKSPVVCIMQVTNSILRLSLRTRGGTGTNLASSPSNRVRCVMSGQTTGAAKQIGVSKPRKLVIARKLRGVAMLRHALRHLALNCRTYPAAQRHCCRPRRSRLVQTDRSEEHTSELQSRLHLVCRLLLEKKKIR